MKHSNLELIEDIGTDEESENKIDNEQSPSDKLNSSSFKLARRISMQQKRVIRTRKSAKLVIGMRNRIEVKWIELGKIGLGGGTLMEGADVNLSRQRITRIFHRFVLKLKAVGIFMRCLFKGPDITNLQFGGCQLTSISAGVLKTVASDNNQIQNLFLSDNQIREQGLISQ